MTSLTNEEPVQRESNDRSRQEEKFPDLAKDVADDTESMMLHQDALSADYQEDECALLAWQLSTLVYAGRKCS